MKMLIFKCQQCGVVYTEKVDEEMKNIPYWDVGKYTHIVNTHKCNVNIFGMAKLIGMKKEGAHDS